MNVKIQLARRLVLRLAVSLTALLASASAMPALGQDGIDGDAQDEAYFKEYVLPIFEEHCYKCHSHASGKAKAGLVLDSRSGWAKGGDSGPAVVPGKPGESLLIGSVRYEDYEMPPTGKLPDQLIARLEQWVARGAFDPRVTKSVREQGKIDIEAGRQHWAFRPLHAPPPPEVSDDDWSWNHVDRFILAQLEEHDLRPSGDADPYTWLRRVSFDLTGLPPTSKEIREFEAAPSRQGREKVVDRLLASRAFGERWARHWLDLVGYADQIGTSNSVFAEHAWRYRDYVIDAYNTDKPFDRFVREQVAGDLLPYASVEERASNLVATGFLVLGDIEIVEADKEKLLVDVVDRQVHKVGKALLGMTLDCARCHDHKFDPIGQHDYYAIGGFFHNTLSIYQTGVGVWSDVNTVELPETEAQVAHRAGQTAAHQERLAELKADHGQSVERKKEVDAALDALSETDNGDASQKARAALKNVQKDLDEKIAKLKYQIVHAEHFAPTTPKAHGVRDVEKPHDMKITIRGNPRALGEDVPRGFLRVVSDITPIIRRVARGRSELAHWLTSPGNPLTARVTVNRIWQKLFGDGLVRSVDYFGLPGEEPSHPELLDDLAVRFMSNGWSQKSLVRTLVLSRTYALDSGHDSVAHAVDPENRLLWRMNRVRLDAEALRDAMIFVGGQLKSGEGGPAIPLEYPENVRNLGEISVNPPSFALNKWRPDQAFERTIYLPVIRDRGQPGPAALRNVFDFPQPSEYTGQRVVTAVPTQALFLLNSPEVSDHAAALTARICADAVDDERLEVLWLRVFNRPISDVERKETLEFLAQSGETAWTELCHALLASNEFLMRL